MKQAYINYLFIKGYLTSIKWRYRKVKEFHRMYKVYCKALNDKLIENINEETK